MKKTSQQYLNSEAHGYLMEAKACKLLLKDLERIRAKLRRHIEKEAADREAEFEAAMQYHSESDIQEPTAGNSSANGSMSAIWNCSVRAARHLMNTAPLLQSWLSPF